MNNSYLRILTFSDWRVQPIDYMLDYLEQEDEFFDIILYAGDDVERFRDSNINYFEEIAKYSRFGLIAVKGNDDAHKKEYEIKGDNVFDGHRNPIIVDGVGIICVEGAVGNLGAILYKEVDYQKHLKLQLSKLKDNEIKNLILLSHCPPKGILDLSYRFGIAHIVSVALLNFIEKYEPILTVCGHSHINGGKIEKLGNTSVINIASHDDVGERGKICIIQIKNGKVEHEFLELPLIQETDLKLLFNVGRAAIKGLYNLGVKSIKDLTPKQFNDYTKLPGIYSQHVGRWFEQKEAIETGVVILKKNTLTNDIANKNYICYDIETNIENDYIWCIGAYDSKDDNFCQFFQKDDENKLLNDFQNYLSERLDRLLISYSNCRFEQRLITECSMKYDNLKPLLSIVKDDIDLQIIINSILIGNFKSYGTKQLANQLGYLWQDSTIDGMDVGLAFSYYQKTGKEPDWKSFLQYNKDDVLGTRAIIEYIKKIYRGEINNAIVKG